MPRISLRLLLLFSATLLVGMLLNWPLRWTLPLLPPDVHCEAPAGTLWHGRCDALSIRRGSGNSASLGTVTWQLHAAELLQLRLGAELRVVRGPTRAATQVLLGFGWLELRELTARAVLDADPLPGFPPGWSGELEFSIARLRWEDERLVALTGTVLAHDLVSITPRRTAIGSYELRFAPSASAALPVGTLQDQGGPLQLKAQLHLQPSLVWELEGSVATRTGADPDLARQIQYLGAADAQGMRPFSLAGNL